MSRFWFTMGCICSPDSVKIGERTFFIRSRLGEGGFSYVDVVEDRNSHKLFALKRIACHSKEDEPVAMVEVTVMNMFHHRNLCPCETFAIVPVNDNFKSIISEILIVMPYYRRGTLQEQIDMMAKTREYFTEERILRIFRGICEGLLVMHEHEPPYAHRDIKPANVLLGDDDTSVIMDFGSADKAVFEAKTLSDAIKLQDFAAEKCTMPFRPPELFTVETRSVVDERTDIWSLGCTLYAMVYLESPFEDVFKRGDSMALAVLGTVRYPITSRCSNGLIALIKSMLVPLRERPRIRHVIDRVDAITGTLENRI